METPSQEPDKQDLTKQIEMGGKPLEMIISSFLDGHSWQSVTNTDTFVDRESGKLRDIDICAALTYPPPRIGNLEFETYLLLECKNDPGIAWVFFTRPFKFKVEDISGQYLDEIQMATRNTENIDIMSTILSKARLHYEKFKSVAVTHTRVFLAKEREAKLSATQKKRMRKNHILDAQNQLKKYIDWSTDQDIRKRSQVLPYSIEVYFPCIVFQGHMYEATVENSGKVSLEKKNHIVLDTLFRSPYSVYEKNLLIDVISGKPFDEKCFTDYQGLIRQDIASLEECVRQNSDEISNRISNILELVESTQRARLITKDSAR
jgi:hypothetical protein